VKVLLVALLGAAGALSRYVIGRAVGTTTFPWATLGINLAGCFVLGLLLAGGSGRLAEGTVTGLSVGFLGAFTTFSTFGYETQTLLRDDRAGAALGYVALSVVAGIAFAALGHSAGRALQ
jgi:CrcB protein